MKATLPTQLAVDLPDWAITMARDWPSCVTDDDRMALVIALSRENVARSAGGPFGAAVFDDGSGALVAIGVNSVQRLSNCALHAEVTALMFGLHAVGTHSFAHVPGTSYLLVTSCDPCAMCLGALLWSGVRRVVCGATRDDAMAIGFDEGPVFPESMTYLAARGIVFTQGLRRAEARAVLEQFVASGGPLY